MVMPFNADEVFEMAEQIERNGAKFYRGAAQKFPALKGLFLDLAAMEDDHIKTFAGMRTELSGGEQESLVFDPDGEAQMYLKVMADAHVFNIKADPSEKLAGLDSPAAVLKLALGVERDSIAFYVGLKDGVSQKAGKDKVDAIIKQEIGHIALLNEKLTSLG